MVLATIVVAVRLAARRSSAAKLWWDDYLIVLALVGMTKFSFSARLLLIIPSCSIGDCQLVIGQVSGWEPAVTPYHMAGL